MAVRAIANNSPYIGAFTWAQLFALTGMNDGAEAVVTDIPAGGGRSLWYYDATATRWRVYAPTTIAFNNTPITGIQQLADQYIGGLLLPTGILKGATFSTRVTLGKDGTTDAYGAATQLRIGTAGTTADTSVINASIGGGLLVAANRLAGFETFLRMTSATAIEKQGTGAGTVQSFLGTGGTQATGTATISDVTSNALYVGWSTSMGGTTNRPQIVSQAVILHP